MPESKVKSLLAQEVDPRKAVATVDLELIDSVAALDQEKKCVCVCVCVWGGGDAFLISMKFYCHLSLRVKVYL